MSLDRNDKLSLGLFGLGAIFAYGLAVLANKKSFALAEEGSSPPPRVPENWRVVRIQRKVGEGPAGTVEYTEKLKYLLPEAEPTPAGLRRLQKELGHPNPTGYVDEWTRRVFGQVYTTWTITGGPRAGQTEEGPSLLDMVTPARTKSPLGKGVYDPKATYGYLSERGPARSGKGRTIAVEEAVVVTPKPSPRALRGIPADAPRLDVEVEGIERVTSEGEKMERVVDDLVTRVKQGTVLLPTAGRAPMSPKERAALRRETAVGLFESLSPEEQEALVEGGYVDEKTHSPTIKAVLDSEARRGIHPVTSSIPEVRVEAVRAIERKLGMPETGVVPVEKYRAPWEGPAPRSPLNEAIAQEVASFKASRREQGLERVVAAPGPLPKAQYEERLAQQAPMPELMTNDRAARLRALIEERRRKGDK